MPVALCNDWYKVVRNETRRSLHYETRERGREEEETRTAGGVAYMTIQNNLNTESAYIVESTGVFRFFNCPLDLEHGIQSFALGLSARRLRGNL